MTNGPAISVKGLKQFQDDQINDIQTFGKNVTQSIQAAASAQTNTLTAYLAGYAAMRKGILKARAAANVLQQSSPANTPFGSCAMPATSVTYQTVLNNARDMRSALPRAQFNRDVTPVPARTAVDTMAQATPEMLSATTLYPTQDNPNGPTSANAANTYIGILTNWAPMQAPDVKLHGAALTQWTAQTKADLARIVLAQQALSDIAAPELATVNTNTGPLSEMGILRQEVAKRQDNPAWLLAISKEGSPGLAKDVALMGAVSLAQQKQFLNLTNSLLAVQTARYAQEGIDPLVTLNRAAAAAARMDVLPH